MMRHPVEVTPAARQRLLDTEETRHGAGEHIQPGTVVTAEIETKPGHHADIIVSYRWEHLGQKCGLKRRHRIEDLVGFTLECERDYHEARSISGERHGIPGSFRYTLDAEAPATGAMLQQTAVMAGVTPEELSAFVKVYGAPKQGKTVKLGDVVEFPGKIIDAHIEPGVHDMQTMRNKRAMAWLDEQVEEVCKLGRLQ